MSDIHTSNRRSDPFALALFLAAYLVVLAIVFAPKGYFTEHKPGVEQYQSGEGPSGLND